MERFIKFLFISIFTISSCGEDVTSEVGDVELGDIFEISYGENITIESDALTLSFTDVNEDSRCAEDVTCIWQGRLVIELMVNDQTILISSLDHISFYPGNEILVDGYKISFVDKPISPTSVSTNTPVLDEYKVSLKVEKV